MSAEAVTAFAALWEKLTIDVVDHHKGREPEDVLRIDLYAERVNDEGKTVVNLNVLEQQLPVFRWAQVPVEVINRARISWRYYYCITKNRVFLGSPRFRELDFGLGIHPGYDVTQSRPPHASIIGQIEPGPKGPRFKWWSPLPWQLRKLIDLARMRPEKWPSEAELAHELYCTRSGYPDQYWALARLVFFDDVQAFVDQYKEPRVEHPCKGHLHNGDMVRHSGMYLADSARFVHNLAHTLKQIGWWEEFLRLAEEQGVAQKYGAHWRSKRDCLECLRVIDFDEYCRRW